MHNAKITEKRMEILDELAAQAGIDRSDLLNQLTYKWVIQQVAPDLKNPVKDVFGY
jgi:hypothetical protein